MIASKWERRIQRAEELAAAYSFAAEVLQFYKHIAGFQKIIYSCAESASARGGTHGLLPQDPDLHLLLPRFHEFLAAVEKVAPQPLAQAAAALNAQGSPRWQGLLASQWRMAA